ncbi:glycoside hydrolase family 28 protein [Oidiodendron maius Zn]|uniref:endo-polygalacturonase n=1 Tax=Oidiodendron maius (strain Zn) TaxID=913774 RepID=A0A0C3D791_OIDMZ|nr:glycoside hydrolase family 28 protein [Oidiodendron maius Zn]
MLISFLTVALAGVVTVRGDVNARDSCSHDNCLRAFIGAGSSAVSFCQTHTSGAAIPTFAANCDGSAARVASACSCIYTAPPTSTPPVATITSTTASPTTTTTTPCHCTAWSQISPAVAACLDITLDNIQAPTSSAIILTKLQTGASVTFKGRTSFDFTNSSQFKPIQIAGNHVSIVGAPGSVIDGGGQQYWDGLGTNGGRPKPGQFMKVQITNHSIMRDLYIENIPSHGINVAGVLDSTIQNIVVNNSLGDAPNSLSGGLAAAHNTDAFDVGNCVNLLIQDCKVWNQDDCVVVSDSTNVTVRNVFCSGSHGLSIAGGGTGPGHNISNILFTDSVVTNSTNGLRIKTDFNATGSVVNVTYSNIALSNIKQYGIDIEQDYLNGGPSGIATNGVRVENIRFENVAGWVVPEARDYYVLCGDGSCNGITYKNVHITGGEELSSCNYPWSGCPGP